MVTDAVTGVIFSEHEQFWEAPALRCLGACGRVKRVAMMAIKVRMICTTAGQSGTCVLRAEQLMGSYSAGQSAGTVPCICRGYIHPNSTDFWRSEPTVLVELRC